MNRVIAAISSAAFATTWVTTAARADTLYLAGAEHGATASYAYAGAILPLPGNTLGSGFGVRLWTDYLAYSYKSGTATIDASAWGGEIAGVYQFSGSWGWTNLSAGARYRDTSLSPNDPGNRARGAHVYATVQLDGGYNIDAAWRARWTAGYTATLNGYFVQPAIDRAISDRLRLGIDATFMGDRTYKQVAGGVNLSIVLDERHTIALRAGASDNGVKRGIYGGLSFVLTTS
jgi:Cellulose biosynthesis protein BcsS